MQRNKRKKNKKREKKREERRKKRKKEKWRGRLKAGERESGEDVGGGGSDRPDRKIGRENARGEHIQLRKMKFFLAEEVFLKFWELESRGIKICLDLFFGLLEGEPFDKKRSCPLYHWERGYTIEFLF